MVEEEIFEELERFHLSKYEIKAYSCLLLSGAMKPTDIIKETGIPQPRIYDILGKLQRKGLVIISSRLKKSYEAVMPEEAFKSDLDDMKKYLSTLEDHVKKSRKNFPVRVPNMLFIQNSNTAENKLENAIENAESEILFSLPSEKIMTLISSLKKAHQNGVTLCFVLNNNLDRKIIDIISEIGILKTSEMTNAEMVIIDRKISFFNGRSVSLESNYSVFLQEDELMDIMSYYYFFMNWLPANYIIDFNFYKHEFKVTTSWLACDAIENLMAKGKRLRATVLGVMNEEIITIGGDVISITRIPGKIQSFNILSENGEITVGGRNGKLEQVKMIDVTFYIIH